MPVSFRKSKPESQIKGTVTKKTSHGGETSESIVVGSKVEAPVMASVGLRVSRTLNLGNYNSVKVEISLHMPAKVEEKDINKSYAFALEWVNNKMTEVMEEVEASIE